MGDGADRFQWDPGDGSDVVEGEAGNDLLDVFGSGANETIDVSADGGRLRFIAQRRRRRDRPRRCRAHLVRRLRWYGHGTSGPDVVDITRSASQVLAAGLAAKTRIVGSETANDTLRIQTLGGDDEVTVARTRTT